ncbi:MAG: iron-dependent transcriptional repressor, DtxR family [Actinomycetota bacterium]
MTDLIDTTEMYLRTILELEEEGQVPLRARIAERLDHSGPTVSQTVARMERDDLLVVSDDRHLELTEHGRILAVRVMRKHRLAERLLADVIGLEWEFVHEEACRWEHVMSEQVERKILGLIDRPDLSPYGNPIPGLAELGEHENVGFASGVLSAPAAMAQLGRSQGDFVLRRIGEPLQVDAGLLAELKTLGLLPGAAISVEHHDDHYLFFAGANQDGVTLAADDAQHLFVDA